MSGLSPLTSLGRKYQVCKEDNYGVTPCNIAYNINFHNNVCFFFCFFFLFFFIMG